MQPSNLRRGTVTVGLPWRSILFVAAILFMLAMSGCACKLTPAQLSKDIEQIDRNADFILQKIEAGELPTKVWAESHKQLTAATKKLAEAHNASE